MKHFAIFSLLLACGLTVSAETLDRSAWTWSSSSICAPGADTDIAGLEGIHDGNPATCWHSNYLATNGTPERSNPHWIQIDRGTDTKEFSGLAYLPRQNTANQACTSYYIYLRDSDMSSTPATTTGAIISALGVPDYQGTLVGNTAEKYIDFDKTSKARYILFVNVASQNSSSAACAEMNLYNGTPGSEPVPSKSYNALKITPRGSSTPHRIALDGDALTISASFDYIRLSNSDITVEYAMSEVERFNFEQYEFGSNNYTGNKKDVLTSRFSPSVTPAAGKVEKITEVTIAIPASAGDYRINRAVTFPVSITCGKDTLLRIAPESLPDFATAKGYTFSGLNIATDGTYKLNLAEEFFACADGTRSNAVNHQWTIGSGSPNPPNPDDTAIDEVGDDCQTLTFSRNGSLLILGGIDAGSEALLYNIGGLCVASAQADALGHAALNVGALPKGVYLLNVNNITLKITL